MNADTAITYTARQHDIMGVLAKYIAENGISPTMQEIGDILSISRVSVFEHLFLLEGKGAIKRTRNKSRSVQVLDPKFQQEGINLQAENAALNEALIRACRLLGKNLPCDVCPAAKECENEITCWGTLKDHFLAKAGARNKE